MSNVQHETQTVFKPSQLRTRRLQQQADSIAAFYNLVCVCVYIVKYRMRSE